MPQYLDLDTWSRRETFEFFHDFDKPYFNVCVHLDVTRLVDLQKRTKISSFLAYHYLALRMANDTEPFRYRLHDGKVVVHEVIHGGSTLLLPNESFAFVYFDYQENFQKFASDTSAAIVLLTGYRMLVEHIRTLPYEPLGKIAVPCAKIF